AFSWVWVLVPLALMGDTKAEYLGAFILIMVTTDLHRHFGLPYVYLDAEVRSRFRLRFLVFPVAMLLVWAGSPYFARYGPELSLAGVLGGVAWLAVLVQLLRRDRDGEPPPWGGLGRAVLPAAALAVLALGFDFGLERGWVWLATAAIASGMLDAAWRRPGARRHATLVFIGVIALVTVFTRGSALHVRPRDLLNGAAVVAGAWNIWHVLMQKYGIMRLYNAKSGRDTKVPGWVDRLVLFAWIPFFLVWLGPANRESVMTAYARGAKTLLPFLDAMEAVQPIFLAPSIALIVGSLVAFVVYERRANGLSNAPRLWLVTGTTLLSVAFFFVHPIKVYLAYAFSHAVEYMVFVWAFQRRRYATTLPHRPLLGRILQRPWLAYGGFIVVGAVLIVVLKYYGRTWLPHLDQPYFVGIPTAEWFMYWGVYQSMLHFYFDGFMWKMRRSSTRAHI
ncbi:MAG: hypothetical protein AAF721_20705, partial [Myxococcota bacterium]